MSKPIYSFEIQGLMDPHPPNPFTKQEQRDKIINQLKEIEKRLQKIEKLLQDKRQEL